MDGRTFRVLEFCRQHEFRLFTGVIPEGETLIVIYSFVNDLEINLPTDAGLRLTARGFVHDTNVMGHKEDHIFAPFEYEMPDYLNQSRKINIQSLSFVSEVEIN